MKENKKLYILDFDGTLIKKDSMILFFKYINSNKYYYYLFLFSLHFFFVKNKKRKFIDIMLNNFLKKSKTEKEKCYLGFVNQNKKLLNESLILDITNEKNTDFIIATASLDIWVLPFLKELPFPVYKVISSKYTIKNDKIELIENCKGDLKVKCIMQSIDLKKYNYIHSFGNSIHDLKLKKISNIHTTIK